MGTLNDLNTTIDKIKQMQSKWGIGQTGISKSSGDRIEASTVNGLMDCLRQAKSKSGWGGGVSSNVSVGEVIKNVLSGMNGQADAIKSYCACNCNHCQCNCNYCKCDCHHCHTCSSPCDSSCDSKR